MTDLQIQGEVDPRGQRAVRQLLADEDGRCKSAIYVDQTDSTNTLAILGIRNGLLHETAMPQLVLADRQNAGRGRLGRSWISDEGTLTMTLVLSGETPLDWLPLAVGVGVARHIEFEYAPLRVRLKWPNDVWVDGRKLAGILCETCTLGTTSKSAIVIGVGVNVSSAPDFISNETTTPALGNPSELPGSASLSHQVGRPVHRYELMGGLVQSILETIDECRADTATIAKDFRARCALDGSLVTYLQDGQSRTGQCLGIDETGALLVHPVGSQRPPTRLRSGDVSQVRSSPNAGEGTTKVV